MIALRAVVTVFVTRFTTALWNDGTRRKASRATAIKATMARRRIRHTAPITFGGPTRCGRQPASRVRMPKTRLKKRRYHGRRTAIASSSELPQRRQKWRVGSLPSPHWPQMRSPGCRRVGASIARAAGRGRATVGATDVGRRDIGSSGWTTETAGGEGGAAGAATLARTGAATGGAGAAGAALGAAEVTGTVHTTCGAGAAGSAGGAAAVAGGGGTNRGGGGWGGRCRLSRRLLDPDRVLDSVDQADMGRLGLRLRRRRFGLRLRDGDAFPSPFQELPARPAERVVVFVVVAALLADDHPLVTSTVSCTFDRLTTCTLCVTCAGLAAATSASSLVALMLDGSSTETRTMRAKFGDPGSASPALVAVAT